MHGSFYCVDKRVRLVCTKQKRRFNLFTAVTSGRSRPKQYLTSRGAIARDCLIARITRFEYGSTQKKKNKTIIEFQKKISYSDRTENAAAFPHIRSVLKKKTVPGVYITHVL